MFDLTTINLFSGLSAEEVDVIVNLMNPVELEENSQVITEGELSSNLYIIESGELEVYVSSRTHSGSRFTLATIGSGSYFGEYAFLDDAPRTASVITLTPSKLLEISKKDFTIILQRYPTVYTTMVKNLVATIRHLNNEVTNYALKLTYPLLREYLINQSALGYNPRKKSNALTAKVIAELIDCQMGTVASLLTILEENNYIYIDEDSIDIYKTLPENIN